MAGVTASGLFSQSAIIARDKPHANHHDKASPTSTAESACGNTTRNLSSLSNASYTSDHHQEKIRIVEDENQIMTYSGDRSYTQSQDMTVNNQGTLHAFTVALALSIHSIFEGLAFGLQDTVNQVCKYVHCKYICNTHVPSVGSYPINPTPVFSIQHEYAVV